MKNAIPRDNIKGIHNHSGYILQSQCTYTKHVSISLGSLLRPSIINT